MTKANQLVSRKPAFTLNTLIETCRDGENGFRAAADTVKDPQIKATFAGYSQQRRDMVRQLQAQVARLGAEAEESGTVAATIHRGWMNILALVSGVDDAAIVAEAERGEDVATRAFQTALEQDLPADARALVEQLTAQVRAAHDEVRGMQKSEVR